MARLLRDHSPRHHQAPCESGEVGAKRGGEAEFVDLLLSSGKPAFAGFFACDAKSASMEADTPGIWHRRLAVHVGWGNSGGGRPWMADRAALGGHGRRSRVSDRRNPHASSAANQRRAELDPVRHGLHQRRRHRHQTRHRLRQHARAGGFGVVCVPRLVGLHRFQDRAAAQRRRRAAFAGVRRGALRPGVRSRPRSRGSSRRRAGRRRRRSRSCRRTRAG